MKKNKKGFTVVELLLCIGIIGIVSAMGMMLTKQSTDRAYNLYYYNAYINLYNAIADAISLGQNDTNNILRVATDSIRNPDIEPVLVGNMRTIVTRNNITYEYNQTNGNEIDIAVRVPQRKTRNNNGVGTMNLLYINDRAILVPRLVGAVNESNPDVQNRRDLLPTYIDNGTVGRVINGVYDPIPYFSYREAYCRLNNASLVVNGVTRISCVGLAAPPNRVVGFLKFESPSKAR